MSRILQLLIIVCASVLSMSVSMAQQTSLPIKIEAWYNEEQYDLIINDSKSILAYADEHIDSVSAELLFFLSDAYLVFDDIEQAISIIEKEKGIRENFKPIDELMIADLSYNLGYYHQLLNNYSQAKTYYSKAIANYKAIEGVESESYFEANISLNQLLRAKGDFLEAKNILKHLEENIEDEKFLSIISREQIDLFIQLGLFSKAESKALALIDINEEKFGKASVRYMEVLNLLALIKTAQSNYAEAELFFEEAIDIAEKLALQPIIIDNLKNNLAIIYSKIGLYEESNAILEKIITEEANYDNALSLRNMGVNYAGLNKAELANNSFQKALAVIEDVFSENSLPYIESIKDYANKVTINTNLDTTLFLLNNSLNNAQKLLKKSNPELSKYELHLGRAYFKANDLKRARIHLENAYELRKKHLSNNHPLYAESTKKMAELAWASKKEKQALDYYHDTFRNYFNQIEAYFPALSEQQKANFYTNILRPTFEEYNSYIISYHQKNPELLSDMYNYQLATKGLIMYASAKARENILNSGNEELIQQFQDWIQTKEQVAKAYSLSEEEIKSQSINLDSLLSTATVLEKALSRASAEFSSVYESKKTDWKDIQQKLTKDEAAIEMIRFRVYTAEKGGQFLDKVNYAALLIDKNSKYPELILLENGDELEGKFMKNYRNSIKYKVSDKYSYDNYWKAIALKTKKYDKLYFSPDGVYNQISINSLYNNSSNKYVLEEQNIQLLTNTKDLIAYRTKKASTTASANPAQLFGFPNYDKGSQEDGKGKQIDVAEIANNVSLDRGLRGSLSRYIRGNSLVTLLPGTKEEIEKITVLYGDSKNKSPIIHLSNEADEQQLKEVNNPSVLHIATHGFFLEDTPTDQEFSDDKYSQNPLLKSGLIMAGANSFITGGIDEASGQDGILTAYEAMNMQLANTDLVVLSACETGLGDLKNGEGVYGLRRAFFVAGADAIIMSLWSVDDAATQELMTSFYENWLAGTSKEQAFINAQLSTKEKYADPFYWAAFVMVGE